MTPEQLGRYLDELRTRGAMRAVVKLPDAGFEVEFGPEASPLPGDAPTPGGWKSPPNLDSPQVFEDSP